MTSYNTLAGCDLSHSCPVGASRTLQLREVAVPAVQQSNSEPGVAVLDEIKAAAQGDIDTAPLFIVEAKEYSKPARRKLIRRDAREYSQQWRFAMQLFLVALNLWVGIQFYFGSMYFTQTALTENLGRRRKVAENCDSTSASPPAVSSSVSPVSPHPASRPRS